MAVIARTAAQIGLIYPDKALVIDMIATEAVAAGQAVYQATTGKVGLAGAAAAGKQQFRGIALRAAAAGAVVPVLKEGHIYGYTVASVNGDAPLYLSDTLGALDDGPGTMTVVAGRVTILPDGNATKVAYISAEWGRIWA
jgi:hypothetical protein